MKIKKYNHEKWSVVVISLILILYFPFVSACKNGVNGFEVSKDGVMWQSVVSVAIADGQSVFTANEKFSYIRYAYNTIMKKTC